jgi:hypothetical protein
LAAGAGPPSLLYNHVNRSFLWGRGLFDLAGLAGSAIFFSLCTLRLSTRSVLFAAPAFLGEFVPLLCGFSQVLGVTKQKVGGLLRTVDHHVHLRFEFLRDPGIDGARELFKRYG